jgi:asparagine N-glycosylation enzyme membrane subunit Stt3
VAGHDGGGRYRIMFEPLLIILAAYAVVYLVQKYFLKTKKEYYGITGA